MAGKSLEICRPCRLEIGSSPVAEWESATSQFGVRFGSAPYLGAWRNPRLARMSISKFLIDSQATLKQCPQSRYDIFMNLKFAVSLGSALLVLKFSALALDPEKQAVIDRYKQPFAVYLTAINDLGSALDTVTTESDLIKAADKFCDQANKFVDKFNANKDQFAESQVVKSMDDDPDSKKAMDDYMEPLKSKLEDARPIFEHLISSLSRHSDSREINRVRDRVAATFQRIQLLYM